MGKLGILGETLLLPGGICQFVHVARHFLEGKGEGILSQPQYTALLVQSRRASTLSSYSSTPGRTLG